ncbi:MAG: CYTH domain-containing protein [Phenylobacterium sp.]|jgi:CYTH domain-containing protein
MPRLILPADPGLGQRVLDLQSSVILESLVPEELYGLARFCKSKSVSIEQANQPLEGLDDSIVFIVEGLFERVYFKDKTSMNDHKSAVVLNQLSIGDTWGEHFLAQEDGVDTWHIGLRARAAGRIVTINAQQFESVIAQWPGVHKKLLSVVLSREFTQGLQLGAAKAQIEHTDYVIDRIESVANFLIEQSDGKDGQKTQIQKKFLLNQLPNLNGRPYKMAVIEQAYLATSEDREDRIRSKDSQQFTRTTKVGSGQSRKTFERSINHAEFNKLMDGKTGRKIIKKRYTLEATDEAYTIDHFDGEGSLKDLCLLEVDFVDEGQAKQFEVPSWLTSYVDKEVTEDRAYSNRYLAQGQ